MTIPIRDLDPGSEFTLPDSGVGGTVVHHSPGGTLVRYDRKTRKKVKGVEFDAPAKPVTISGGTEVDPK